MSGGSYDYAYGHINDLAFRINEKANIERPDEFARREAFASWLLMAAEVARAIEWHDSGDTGPNDEAKAMDAFLALSPKVEVLRQLIEHAEHVKTALDVAVREANK